MTESDEAPGTRGERAGSLRTPDGIVVPAAALHWRFTRSSGAGGQHVNTSDTKVTLTLVVADADLPDAVAARLVARHGATVHVTESSTRSQWRNRQRASERLGDLIDQAAKPNRPRRATRVTKGSIERRLASKRRQSERKADRRAVGPDD